MARGDVFRGLLDFENAQTRRKIASREIKLKEETEQRLASQGMAGINLEREKLEETALQFDISTDLKQQDLTIRGAYMEALTANQVLQNTVTDQRIKSDITEKERQIVANKSRATGFQADLYGMKIETLKEMLKSSDPEENQKARNIAIGYTASQDAALALKGLTLQNQQMNTAINLMGQRMQQDAQNRDAISDALELVMAGAGGIGEKAFGKEQFNTLANVLYQNAIKAALPGGELVPSSVVPEIAPQDPGIMSKIGNLLGFGGDGAAAQTGVDPGTSGLEPDEDLEAGLRNLQK